MPNIGKNPPLKLSRPWKIVFGNIFNLFYDCIIFHEFIYPFYSIGILNCLLVFKMASVIIKNRIGI